MSNYPFYSLQKSASKFIEELRSATIETKVIHKSEVVKANSLIKCIRAVMSKVEKEVGEVEGKFKEKGR